MARAVKRIEAFRSSTGYFAGSAVEELPEPEEAGTTFGVNETWLRLARATVREASERETRRSPNMGRINTD